MSKIVGIVSLGCAKNQSDTEVLCGYLTEAGMTLTGDVTEADVVIVNTCSFILDARTESLDAIEQMAEEARRRPADKPLKIIVAGCLPQRYREKMLAELPQADAFMGIDELPEVVGIIEKLFGKTRSRKPLMAIRKKPQWLACAETPRARLTLPHIANVKIAEGCNHGCAFCAIPMIRGRFRSRPVADIVAEVKTLVQKNGVKEINLIAQDTTYYGMDTWAGTRVGRRTEADSKHGDSLVTLLKALDKIKGDFWIRVQYTHPAHWSDELIEVFAKSKHVAKYVDIPLQHISDKMLASMSRETDGAFVRRLLEKIRRGVKDVAIRTSLIVGFPGETDEDFKELLAFVKDVNFERAGVFKYSKEDGTKGATMPHQCSMAMKERRYKTAMEVLKKLSKEQQRSRVGQKIRVLVDAPGIARSEGDAFEVDGIVHVPRHLPVGEFAEVVVSGFSAYDLIAK
ncbi:MAG: 30S ribosomal protein S12 methylthiotransferase RimO [Opitutales bacterium]|nr:30S ribosomal protein S12 methylthiotransferase RimO [Opitutales bacterium]